MERLTRTINVRGNSIVVYTKGKYEDTTAAEMRNEDIREVMKKLAEYERTKLTPEQIRELVERDTAKKIEINAGVPICPVCGRRVVRCYDFCPDCGQRLWEDE